MQAQLLVQPRVREPDILSHPNGKLVTVTLGDGHLVDLQARVKEMSKYITTADDEAMALVRDLWQPTKP
eukprot:1012310-Amphidinium_carterae.1